jgi:hypothetical protein
VNRRLLSTYLWVALAAVSATVPTVLAGQSPTQSTRTIPVIFTRDVDAAHAKSGDVVTAKTLQLVWLDGSRFRSGATVVGHVVDARPFTFDPTPYAKQQPSLLSIHFDKIESAGTGHDLSVGIRALAHPGDSREARTMHHLDEHDTIGYFVLVGGDSYRSDGQTVVSADGDIVGYRRRDGIYARLLSGDYRSRTGRIACAPTDDEQPVAVFSAAACGVYGLKDVYLVENGRSDHSGTFRLESFHHSVNIYKGSAALLQNSDGQ